MTPDDPQIPGQQAPRPIAAGAAERIATIIEAAERAAAAVVDSADANARHYLEDAQAEADRIIAARLASFSELTDSLVAQAQEVRRQSERLLEAMARANSQIELSGDRAEARPAPAPGAVEPPFERSGESGVRLTAVSPPAEEPPVAAVEQPPVESGEDQAAAAGARLLATQMAVSGSSREEIETRLRTGFQIEDTASILDAILGPEG